MGNTLHTIDIVKLIIEAHSPASLELNSYLDIPGTENSPRADLSVSVTSPMEAIGTIQKIFSETQSKTPPWDLGFYSRLKMRDGRLLHVPQIDFRAKAMENGLVICKEKILSVIARAKSGKTLPGYLLCSGKSYHYIGTNLLTEDEWLEFMGLCLLCEDWKDPYRFSPIDRLFIGRSLIRQKTALRIFPRHDRPEPYVVDYITAT